VNENIMIDGVDELGAYWVRSAGRRGQRGRL
jgi:hypothetical protein